MRATPQQVARALGDRSLADALRGPARDALPTVVEFERSLPGLTEAERTSLLAVADDVLAHRFDLLGSGPVHLGPRIDWHRDFKSGRRWPAAHITRVPITYDDDSDIKVPWELSRFQHGPVLAAAFRVTGERRYLDELGAQLTDWIEANPVEFGPNWACTMDVAIRAANWVAALVLCADAVAEAPWADEVAASLLLHGRFVRRHLEWAPVRGNHYLADVVGLMPVAAVFSGSREGEGWASWASDEAAREMAHQVRPDGCDHEASIPYHRLVAELFACGGREIGPMLRFTAAYTRGDGLAPQMGDADDGRFLPLGDYGRADHRSHQHLFAQAGVPYEPATGHAAFPDGGWYVMRANGLHMVVRCGDVGVGGLGSHAHNDQLSFELSLGEQPLVIDPGSYLYTADLAARARFRSTACHSTLSLDGREQNPLRQDAPFALQDTARAERLAWEADGPRARFSGRHQGFAPAVHERRIAFDGEARRVTIEDVVRSPDAHEVEWTFPLAGGDVTLDGETATARLPHAELALTAGGVTWSVEEGWRSPSYGVREPTPFLRARARSSPGEHVTTFRLKARER